VSPFERLPAWTADRLTRLRVQNQAARMITVTVVEIKHVEQSPLVPISGDCVSIKVIHDHSRAAVGLRRPGKLDEFVH
jgi:hypothetical protein